jgi:segregation and condensation protein B
VSDEPSLFPAPPLAEQERMVEAMLFASAEPLTAAALNARMPPGCDAAEALVRLARRYEGRGVRLVRVGDAWAFRTAPDLAHLMHREAVETKKLSRAAIETLAIIAYHQPVTRAEIEAIRGVAVSRGTIDQLLELDWIRLGRRRQTPGRPVTFVVTQRFLDHFGLESTRDLPGLKELREAGLLDPRAAGAATGDEASPEGQSELFED